MKGPGIARLVGLDGRYASRNPDGIAGARGLERPTVPQFRHNFGHTRRFAGPWIEASR